MKIEVGNIHIDVIQKDIKNIHLSILPPDGRVRISAPYHIKSDEIRMFAISKLLWIRKNKDKFKTQMRETPREFIDRESHYLWGKRYLLSILETQKSPSVDVQHKTLLLNIKSHFSREDKEQVLNAFYRNELRSLVSSVIRKFEKIMHVKVKKVYIQRMKTRWGSCNFKQSSIRLNSELAKKPIELVEYVIAHEMAHLLIPNHGPQFISIMNKVMPTWKHLRDELNALPLGHENWKSSN